MVFTPKEVATKFKVNPETVLRLIRSRSLSAVKIGAAWRITQDQLDAYLDKRTTKTKK